MRILSFVACLICSGAPAQVITSVADGEWTDSSTWDCLCVPDSEVVMVEHQVAIVGDLLFYFDSVHIAPTASLWMPDTNFIIVFGKIQNEGLMDMRGHFDIIGDMASSGTVVMHGIFHNFGTFSMEGATSSLQVDGDLVNEGIITGEGSICISTLTYNNGLISGFVDFCDMSPSTSVNPIIDVNSGTVTDDVTFCAASSCANAVPEPVTPILAARPVPAFDAVTVICRDPAVVLLTDARGRTLRPAWRQEGDHVVVERGALPAGVYQLRAFGRNDAILGTATLVFIDP